MISNIVSFRRKLSNLFVLCGKVNELVSVADCPRNVFDCYLL
jgi:hypothetical protein